MTNKPKTRNFSIYLLKKGSTAANAFKEGTKLKEVEATKIPDGSSLFLLDRQHQPPWWKGFWGITQDLMQGLKSAVLILPIEDRHFALTFGAVYHELAPNSYEYDFGLRVTLNSVNPELIKSTDSVSPTSAQRQRTQLPTASELTYFDFDSDRDVIKSLTGKTRKKYAHLFKQSSGAASLRAGLQKHPEDISTVCSQLLALYNKDDYEELFPSIQNLRPIHDPTTLDILSISLVEALKSKNSNLSLGLPEIIDLARVTCFKFSGVGQGLEYSDATIQNFYDYFETKHDLEDLTYEGIKKCYVRLCDEEGHDIKRYPLARCLLFDTALKEQETCYLSDGKWYQVKNAYLTAVENEINPIFKKSNLPPYTKDHANEADYNKKTSDLLSFTCMDAKNIAPMKQTQIEPCDMFRYSEGAPQFYHIKRGTRSASLSHLFNQGVNSIELIKSVPEAQEKFFKLMDAPTEKMKAEVVSGPHAIVYGIITSKDQTLGVANLPLFSKISLRRTLRSLKAMSVNVRCSYIEDQS